MSLYSLLISRIGRASVPSDGEHDIVTVLADGQYQRGLASASLALEGHDGRPGSCTVFVPIGVVLDGNLASDYTPHLLGTAPSGTRHYTFSTRDAALTFLRRIYVIDAPSATPTTVPNRAFVQKRASSITPVSPRSVPAPLARDVVHLAPPIPRTTDRAFFHGPTTYQHPLTHHQRNTQ